MRVVVLVKPVGNRRPVLDRQTRLVQSPTSFTLGPHDELALEHALALRERGHRVTALCAGPPSVEGFVQRLARRGLDEVVAVVHPVLDGADALAIGRTLAAALDRIGFDLVLAGDCSPDDERGAVPGATAGALEVPHLGGVHALETLGDVAVPGEAAGGSGGPRAVRVLRHAGRAHMQARLALPALVAVAGRSPFPASAPAAAAGDGAGVTMDAGPSGAKTDPALRPPAVAAAPAARAAGRDGDDTLVEAPVPALTAMLMSGSPGPKAEEEDEVGSDTLSDIKVPASSPAEREGQNGAQGPAVAAAAAGTDGVRRFDLAELGLPSELGPRGFAVSYSPARRPTRRGQLTLLPDAEALLAALEKDRLL